MYYFVPFLSKFISRCKNLHSVLLLLLSFTIVVSEMVVIVAVVHLILSPIVCIPTYRSITTLIVSPPVVTALNRSNLKIGIPTKIGVPVTEASGLAVQWRLVNHCILSSISTAKSDSLACIDTIIDVP